MDLEAVRGTERPWRLASVLQALVAWIGRGVEGGTSEYIFFFSSSFLSAGEDKSIAIGNPCSSHWRRHHADINPK